MHVHSFVDMNQFRARSMFYPGGSTYRWFQSHVRRPALAAARSSTPTRTGTMAALNYSRMGANKSGLWVQLGNMAGYAKYVHEGTQGPIVPRRGEYLKLGSHSPTGPGFPQFMYLKEVSGQDAQPWLSRSMARILNLNRFYATSSAIRAGA